jgi:dTDP-4-amino-4,6-dideoxygalactose transaminase
MHDINYIDHLCNEETTVTSFSRALSTYSKFNHVQATLGLIQLAELESANNAFRRNAARYDTLIKDHVRSSPDLPDHALRTPYYYMIRVKNRDAFRKKMLKKGIDTKSDDMGNCSQIEGLNQQGMMFPNTEKLCNEITEISNSTDLTEKDSNRIGSMVGSSLA